MFKHYIQNISNLKLKFGLKSQKQSLFMNQLTDTLY